MTPLFHRLFSDAPLLADAALSGLIARQELLLRPGDPLGPQAAEHPLFKAMRGMLKPEMTLRNDGIAVVPVEGVLAHKPHPLEMVWDGMEDSRSVLDMVQGAAGNADVRGILLAVDSPGGFLTGGPEIASAVREANKAKPVLAHIGGMGASLAYWIASQAGSLIANPSAQVGSIGVFTTHVDYSAHLEKLGIKVEVFTNKEGTYKAAGAMGSKLSEEQRGHIQGRMDTAFKMFRAAVTRARPGIPEQAMQGQVFYGSEAKALGLVDGVGDMPFALGMLRQAIRQRSAS